MGSLPSDGMTFFLRWRKRGVDKWRQGRGKYTWQNWRHPWWSVMWWYVSDISLKPLYPTISLDFWALSERYMAGTFGDDTMTWRSFAFFNPVWMVADHLTPCLSHRDEYKVTGKIWKMPSNSIHISNIKLKFNGRSCVFMSPF